MIPLLSMILILSGCDVAVLEVSETEFFIAKEWKIQSVFRDGELQTQADMEPGDDLSSFRLFIQEDFTFRRIYFDGTETAGSWQLTSGLTQLALFVGEANEERWLLLDLKLRRLEMRLLQNPDKPQLDIRYVLEPVKGQ